MTDLCASLYPKWDARMAGDLLARFGLEPGRKLGALSKGQKRQVGLLCAVCHKPRLLVLDEPAGGLDPVARREFLEVVINLLADAGSTVIFSSHILSDLERVAQRLVVLHEGLILLDRPVDDLKENVCRVEVAGGDSARREGPAFRPEGMFPRRAEGWFAAEGHAGMRAGRGDRVPEEAAAGSAGHPRRQRRRAEPGGHLHRTHRRPAVIRLVKHFLRRASPKTRAARKLGRGCVVSLLLVCGLFGDSTGMGPHFHDGRHVRHGYGAGQRGSGGVRSGSAGPRRKLYVAKNLATLLLMVIVEAPVGVTVLVIATRQSHHWEALRICATFVVCWIAILLMTVPFVRLAYRTRSLVAILIPALPLIGISTLFIIAVWGNARSLLTVAAAVPTAALAWFLGRRQFDRYELAPSGDTGPAEVAAARSSLMNHFSPMVRVLAHGVWLQWRYLPLVVYVAALGFIFPATKSYDLWLFDMICYAIQYVSIGFLILWFCGWTGQSLLPFVPRRTILRSVLGPIAATPLLIGGVEAIATGSVQMIVRGLVAALAIVAVIWLMLPSAKKYRRSYLVHLRRMRIILLILCLCILVCAFVPSARDFIQSAFSVKESPVASWAVGNPFLLSCVIVLAIALLWWRCERKFRYFEPFAFPFGFSRAA